jgi:hypothetical protein
MQSGRTQPEENKKGDSIHIDKQLQQTESNAKRNDSQKTNATLFEDTNETPPLTSIPNAFALRPLFIYPEPAEQT